jgi:type IV secretory pathway VirJ component
MIHPLRSALALIACCAIFQPAHAASPAADPETLSHGRFHDVKLYAPAGAPKSFVLFLSGDGGWNAQAAEIARQLSAHGAMVAGIDLPKLEAQFDADAGECVYPDGDLENLSHYLQAYHRLPTYLSPLLLGYAGGASLAYASLAQAPANTFAGLVTVGFCPALTLRKPLCKGAGAALGNPWVLIEGAGVSACAATTAVDFIAKMPGATRVELTPATWLPGMLAAFDSLAARSAKVPAALAPAALGSLPLIEIGAAPGAPPGDTFAILLSGDGGWAGLDKEVAQALAAQGIPVVGLDSLRYFWSARSPAGLAADIDRMIPYYAAKFAKGKVLLIGYSQGADVLPFAVNRLTAAARARVTLTTLLGMSTHALFEFHVSSWISNNNSGPLTLPEVDRMAGTPVLCIYGEGDNDSLCPKLDPGKVRIVKLPGGHHFDGDYARLAREILAAANP